MLTKKRMDGDHFHTPSYRNGNRWSRTWDLLLHNWKYREKSMTARCSVCGKLIEAPINVYMLRIILTVFFLLLAPIVVLLLDARSSLVFMLYFIPAVLIISYIPLLLVGIIPWHEVNLHGMNEEAYVELCESSQKRWVIVFWIVYGASMFTNFTLYIIP